MILHDDEKHKLHCAALLLLVFYPAAQATPQAAPATFARAHNAHEKRMRNNPSLASDQLNGAYQALSHNLLSLAEEKYLACLARRPHEKDTLLGLAVIAQRRLQNDRAAEFYRRVLNEDMRNTAAAAGLISLSAEADPVSAESQLKELLDIKPAAPELHYALGNVLAEQMRMSEAQQAFYRAYSLAPDNPLYAYDLAVSLDRLHQPSAALTYYRKALSLSKPDDTMLDVNAIEKRIRELKE